ncbi:TPA: hypothetical protein CPT92_10680 [Candidatus Gastranaerophilales bacterium HUM_13]|jgi:flagellin-like hook-associated protein FlgL|nr:MAG TPA: hypothetical protein CPT92_10680 [Candidatus Gastranaerophilales bacterium HUM_13]
MLSINTNLGAFIVQSSLNVSTNGLNQAIERMSTGFKINHAKDNAANYSINTNLSSKLSSYEVAQDNVSMGLDMVMTAMDSLELISSHLSRMRDLAEQAANGTYGEDSLKAIQSEIDARSKEIGRIVNNTEYNGIQFFGHETEPEVTIDESKRVINQTTFTKGETYFVTNSDDLVKLQDLVNSSVDTAGVTFELTSDINMKGINFRGIGFSSSVNFQGTFKGNNHVISNLTINTTEDYVGLFGSVDHGSIDSVTLENCNISGQGYVGGLVGYGRYEDITNCYVIGNVTGEEDYVGGLQGRGYRCNITNCYAAGSVSGDWRIGGLIGAHDGLLASIDNSYATSKVTGKNNVGGLVGDLGGDYVNVSNCYATGSVNGNENVGGLAGYVSNGPEIKNCYATGRVTGNSYVGGLFGKSNETYPVYIDGYFDTQTTGQIKGGGNSYTGGGTVTGVTTAELNELIKNGTLPQYNYYEASTGSSFGGFYEVTLQVGVNSASSSSITIDIGIGKIELDLDVTAKDGARNAITILDEYLKSINERQTKLGATYNRLESVIEAIGVNIDNLTSTRSTIRDADIAEESSAYIRYQILQQAATTLMATANQTPSIALQLL